MKYFLGIEVALSSHGIQISRQKYILDLLNDTGFANCQLVKTLIEDNHCLTLNDSEPIMEISSYQRLIGRLIYLVLTHSDTPYAINILSQFMHSPRISHLQASIQSNLALEGMTGWGLINKAQVHGLSELAPIKDISHNPVQQDHMKHVKINRHFIKETLEENKVCT